jgi:sporulation protein YlmC with PRC-barrel domain
MEIFARELSDKTVVDSDGAVVGQLHNVTMNFKTGALENLLVTPDGSPTEQQRHRTKYSSTDEGRYLIGSESVQAVKDQIVVE